MNEKGKIRVGVLNTHVIQYFAPMYRYINQHSEIEIIPIYLSTQGLDEYQDDDFGQSVSWDVDLLTGTNSRFVAGAENRAVVSRPWRMLAPLVVSLIRKEHLDVLIVHGHNTGANHLALIAAKILKIPVYSRCETHLGLPISKLRSRVRSLTLGSYYNLFAGFLAIGSANYDYYRSLGVSPGRIFTMPYSVDNDRFISESEISADQRLAFRSSIGVEDTSPIILFASKFTRRKRPDDLFLACQILHRRGLKFHLVYTGAGEMESELRQLSEASPEVSVRFTGFVNQAKLPQLLSSSDVFVLPSESEPWGLVVNEAMCAALPVVVSNSVGSARDLVRPGTNGGLFEVGEVQQLAAVLEPLVADPSLAREFGQASKDLIKNWGYPECVVGLRQALAATGRCKAE